MKYWYEPDADQVARQIQETCEKIRSLSAEMTITGTFGPNRNTLRFSGRVHLQRPDRWRYEAEGERTEAGVGTRRFRYRLISNGRQSWKIEENTRRYVEEPTRQRDLVIPPMDPIGRLFFTDSWLLQGGGRRTTRLLPASTIDGVACGGIEIVRTGIDTSNRFELHADQKFHVRRIVETYQSDGGLDVTDVTLRKLRIDPPLSASTFAPPHRTARSDEGIERGLWLRGFLRSDTPG